MKNNVFEFKKKRKDWKGEGAQSRRRIDIDHPFDYEEVASITGPDYIRNLNRDGMAVLPSEELKRNFIAHLLRDIEKTTYTKVSGFKIADDYYHYIGHSWVQLLRDGWVRIGIDDFTSKVFGQPHTIRLPDVGDFLMQGDIGWSISRNGYEAPMQSPISGIVFAVNNRIKNHPELVHKDPYGEGWLFLLNPVSLEVNKKGLFSGKECFQWMEKENQSLLELLGPQYTRMAATGGEPIDDIFGHCPDIDWDRLVKTFLRTG